MILLVIALVVNVSARVIVAQLGPPGGEVAVAIEVSQNGGNPFGKGGDNLRRRRAVSKAAEGLTLFATLSPWRCS